MRESKENPILRRMKEQGTTGHGTVSEKRVASKLGARQTPGSGAKRGAKGDAVLKSEDQKFLIESKSTINASLSVELGWLVKIAHEALNDGAVPVLTMSFVTPEGRERPHGDWVAVPRWAAQDLFLK